MNNTFNLKRLGLIFILGFFSLVCALLYRHSADGDLWAKLSIGQQLFQTGTLPTQDHYAFTKTLPVYVDHEWGAGTVFYGLLWMIGPIGLLAFKLILPLILFLGIILARRNNTQWGIALLLTLGSGSCLLLAFTPVVRSHIFTYFLFAVTLFLLEQLRTGHKSGNWTVFGIIFTMLIWVNLHGGFAAGLGAIGIYAGHALVTRQRTGLFITALLGANLITCVNPYGIGYWRVILPALTEKRELITEWQALPVFALDNFLAFRIVFGLCLLAIIIGHGQIRKNIPGLLLLTITAYLGWKSRRHAAFFGIASLYYAGPYFQNTIAWVKTRIEIKISEYLTVLSCYTILALYAVSIWLPGASLQVLAPVIEYPVREADILSILGAKGNLATPFQWGSYCSWRLAPNVKVSCDGRYEAVYPEETFRMNQDFYMHQGKDWDRLLKTYPVDFVLLDLRTQMLKPEDLIPYGFKLVWNTGDASALLCRTAAFAKFESVATNLPPYTVDPLKLK